jgi:multiple sugar transport system permease protein
MLRHSRLTRIVLFILVLIGAFVSMFPLWWLLVSSFTPEIVIFRQSGLWPTQFTLQNYSLGWQGVSDISFGTYFVNSFLLVGVRVIGTVVSSSMVAYAFARLDFSLKKPLFAIMLLLMMLPFHVTLIPRYILFFKLGWIDSYKPLTVPTFFAVQGFFIFLMVQFIRGLPRELDEAATVDGCSPFDIYARIILPLLKPALVTAAIFTFIWSWNDFFSHLLYISNPKLYTVALGLRAFLDATSGSAFGPMFAMALLSLIPTLIFFILAQSLLIEGISTTGLKT